MQTKVRNSADKVYLQQVQTNLCRQTLLRQAPPQNADNRVLEFGFFCRQSVQTKFVYTSKRNVCKFGGFLSAKFVCKVCLQSLSAL